MMKIEAEVVRGQLILKDPRRSSEQDQQSAWRIWPADDTTPLRRNSSPETARANADAEPTTGSTEMIGTKLSKPDPGALLRERRRAAMENLHALAMLRSRVEAAIRENVAIARTSASSWYDYDPPTWEEIGRALGVTKQAAASRYKDAEPVTV